MNIYAELVTDIIADRGWFLSLSEYLPYRAAGWGSTPDVDTLADARLAELAAASDLQIAYFAPMIRFGEDYRFEQIRRLKEKDNEKMQTM